MKPGPVAARELAVEVEELGREIRAVAAAGGLEQARGLAAELDAVGSALRAAPGGSSARAALARAWRSAARHWRLTGRPERADLAQRRVLGLTRSAGGDQVLFAQRFQALVSLGAFEEAFEAAERVLDLSPAVETLRCFWHPWDWDDPFQFGAPHAAALRALPPRRPWSGYLLSLLECKPELCLEALQGAGPRYEWMRGKAGWLLLQAGRWQEGLEALEAGARAVPREWRFWAHRSEGLLCLGRLGPAVLASAQAVARAPEGERGEALAWRGQVLLWAGRYREALSDLDQACSLGAMWAYCWRGGAKLKLGRLDEACGDLERALELSPRDREASYWLAEARRLQGRLDEALRALDALPPVPGELWGLVNRALIFDLKGDQAQARRAFDAISLEVLQRVPGGQHDGARRLGATRAGRSRALAWLLRRARGCRSQRYHSSAWLGRQPLRPAGGAPSRMITMRPAARPPEAQAYRERLLAGRFAEAFELGETLLDGQLPLAVARTLQYPFEGKAVLPPVPAGLLRQPRWRPWASYYSWLAAGTKFDPARARSWPWPRFGWTSLWLGRLLLMQLRFEQALELLERASRYRPTEWRVRGWLAETQACLGRWEEALGQFSQALEEAPSEEAGQVYAWRAELQLWRGRYREALEDADRGCRLQADWAFGWRAGAKLLLGRPREALADADEALRLHDEPEARVWRAECLRALGRPREALEALEGRPGLWEAVERGLARAELGDGAAAAAELSGLPAEALRAAGLTEAAARAAGPREARAALRRLVERARGYRRNDTYSSRIWLQWL